MTEARIIPLFPVEEKRAEMRTPDTIVRAWFGLAEGSSGIFRYTVTFTRSLVSASKDEKRRSPCYRGLV